jgi:hypothetical protein
MRMTKLNDICSKFVSISREISVKVLQDFMFFKNV